MKKAGTLWECLGVGLALCAASAFAQGGESVVLTFDQPQAAGISGFRAFWDQPVVLAENGATQVVDHGSSGKGPRAVWSTNAPGALAFDAVHRSLLVRFPDAAEKLAAEIRKSGLAVTKAELVLPFRDTELWPEGYADPSGMSFLGDLWARVQPQWHAVAYALRRPWVADAARGPTFNAFANGAGYWAKYGAQDPERDRFPQEFGPAEVSVSNTLGRLDVTAALTDPAFGKTLAARLRAVSDQGFLVRKQEYYDIRYFTGAYEWGTAAGGRGILVGAPKLVVTLDKPVAAGKPEKLGALPAPADLAALRGGQPTAVMPTAEQIRQFAAQKGFRRPEWMPDWQWQRVQELHGAAHGWTYPDTPEAYGRWLDSMLAIMPRRWDGFDAAEKTQLYRLYADTWPEYVRDHWKLYWKAWLMPERDIKDLVHSWTQVPQAQEYYARTGDWRGNTQFYRIYCYSMGTMNFNHTAVAGTLLGGHIIGDARVEADGRHGLELWPLRTWTWFDGSTQESLDHYYFSLTLKDQKLFADFGPTPMDRMMGRNVLAKSVEELISSYHPGLRRFIATSGRTGVAYLLGIQDGTKHIVHTLSHRGALTDLGAKECAGGMPVFGHDASPGMIAEQTVNGPWAPEWVANMVDEKPLPYESTVSYKMWGGFSATPLQKRSYMGRNYGLASLDVACKNETVALMGQWRRADKPVETAAELGTLICRFGINDVNLLDSVHRYQRPDGSWSQNPNGSLGTFGGYPCSLQHKNKVIVLTSPVKGLEYPGYPAPAEVKSLQTAIGLMNFQSPPTWTLCVDEQPVGAFPVKVRAGQRITLQDGVSYVGILPLPSTDLGRSDEVVITDQTGPEIDLQGGGKARPALLIQQYNFLSGTPMPKERRASEEVDLASGGFVIELGDAAEYKDFGAFQQHLKEAALEAQWDAAGKVLNVRYKSGSDVLECGYKPGYDGDWNRTTPTDQCFPYRKVNGAWPYLAPGVERDTTLTQIATTGRLEKNGAVLTCEPGKMAYLVTEPVTGTYAGYNPFPEPVADWSLGVPLSTGSGQAGVVTVKADGKLGLASVAVQPAANRVTIDYTPQADAPGKPEMAKRLLVTGLPKAPQVQLNGRAITAVPDGQGGFAIPLTAAP